MKIASVTRNAAVLCLFFLGSIFAISAGAADPADAEKGYVGFSTARNEKSGLPTVHYVAAGSPAAEAGVQVADDLVAVNHVPTSEQSPGEAMRSIDGPVDTTVQLTLRRVGVPDREVSVVRRPLLAVYTPAAVAGEPQAAFRLGSFYTHGPAASRDPAKAAEWYRQAADANYAPAQVEMGYLTANGLGTKRNLTEAAHWYSLGAKQGNAQAARSLAQCYLYGRGVRQSDENAFYYYDQSARQDDPEAEMRLALLYRDGRGVARDLRAAFAWLYRSAGQDDPAAEMHLGFLYLEGRGVPQDNRAAFAWFYRSAVQGDSYGESALAYMYAAGKGVPRDPVEALRWYLKAEVKRPADQGLKNEVAMARLRAFVKDPGSLSALDLAALPAVAKRWLDGAFIVLTAFYVLGGMTLLVLCFRAHDASGKLSIALGWMFFFLESQGVAFLALCLFGTAWGANALLGATSLACALPIILSTGGPVRSRLWKHPTVSVRKLLLYGLTACAALALIIFVFSKIYLLVKHSPLPGQPTLPLLSSAKQTSAWMTYVSAALLMPVAEEIVFRGYLFNALQRHLRDRNVVIVTALVFSAIHFQWLYFLPIAGFGLALGWARLKTGSLWLPVLIHVTNNGLFLAVSF